MTDPHLRASVTFHRIWIFLINLAVTDTFTLDRRKFTHLLCLQIDQGTLTTYGWGSHMKQSGLVMSRIITHNYLDCPEFYNDPSISTSIWLGVFSRLNHYPTEHQHRAVIDPTVQSISSIENNGTQNMFLLAFGRIHVLEHTKISPTIHKHLQQYSFLNQKF